MPRDNNDVKPTEICRRDKELGMATPPKIVGTHHVYLTVSDLKHAVRFYTTVLGFKARRGRQRPVVLLSNGVYSLALNPPWRTLSADESTFDESRVGLDHLAFAQWLRWLPP
jgi:catechol-2,3-dioxygenase